MATKLKCFKDILVPLIVILDCVYLPDVRHPQVTARHDNHGCTPMESWHTDVLFVIQWSLISNGVFLGSIVDYVNYIRVMRAHVFHEVKNPIELSAIRIWKFSHVPIVDIH